MRWLGISCVVAGMLAGCILDEDFKHRGPTVPDVLDDGWDVATPESVDLDPTALAAIHEELLRPERFVGSLAFLVVKDGKLVFETHLRSLADRDHVHHLQSTTKSVTSLMVGVGRDLGYLPSLDTTICSIFPEDCAGLDPRKQAITLEHLLTMRSGLAFDNQDFSVEMWVDQPAKPVRHILGKRLFAEPGERFEYRDADPQLLGYAMQKLAGQTEEELARTLLFAPLGITDWYWDHGAQGESMAAHGLHLRPRDLAKLGQLVLDGGMWRGGRVVSQAWVDLATVQHVAVPNHPRLPYGYLWWIVTEAGGYSTWGHGGQYALVVPARRLVLVMVSFPDTSPDFLHGGELEQFVDLTRPLWLGS